MLQQITAVLILYLLFTVDSGHSLQIASNFAKTIAFRSSGRNGAHSFHGKTPNFIKENVLKVGPDFAGEIEQAVGSEIYAPIFRYGIFLVFSGVVAALFAGFAITRNNLWEELAGDFDNAVEKELAREASKLDGIQLSNDAKKSDESVKAFKDMDF